MSNEWLCPDVKVIVNYVPMLTYFLATGFRAEDCPRDITLRKLDHLPINAQMDKQTTDQGTYMFSYKVTFLNLVCV